MPAQSTIRSHFTAIARRYELANTLLSFGIERLWRKQLTTLAALKKGHHVVDLCTGTAGIIRDLNAAYPGCRYTGVDLTPAMLQEGTRMLRAQSFDAPCILIHGDACRIPVADASTDLVTISFGLRNLPDPFRGISEMARVLKSGGRAVILEFAPLQPGIAGALYGLYRRWIIPIAGGIITGAPDAYRHLSTSIRDFASPEEVVSLLKRNGFTSIRSIPLFAHIAYIYVGEKT